jgi:hypothetical protein
MTTAGVWEAMVVKDVAPREGCRISMGVRCYVRFSERLRMFEMKLRKQEQRKGRRNPQATMNDGLVLQTQASNSGCWDGGLLTTFPTNGLRRSVDFRSRSCSCSFLSSLTSTTSSDSTRYGRAWQEVPPLSARLPPGAPEMSPKRRKPLMVQEAASLLWTVTCERVVYY